MKSYSRKSIFQSLLLLAILSPCVPASAHLVVGTLLKPPSARDVHQIVCPDAGAHLLVQVRDNAPVKPPIINLLVEKDGLSQSVLDKKDGDVKPSPLIDLHGGAGNYTVTVYKTAKDVNKQSKKEVYTLIYHCQVGAQHTDTSRVYLRNE